MMIHAVRLSAVAALCLALGACQPVYRNHGYVPIDEDLAQVAIGQTTQSDLMTLLGTPSAQGMLTNTSWFWVKSRFQHFGPYRPDETQREVVAVTSASDGTVANVERFGLERERIVRLSARVTDPGVSAGGALRQILGNFGRFRADQFLNES